MLALNEMVSIIVLAYNDEETIQECLHSLIRQTYPNKEILVINDLGSTDNTSEVVWDIANKFNEVKVFEFPHMSRSRARNLGIRNAKGKIIAFAESDATFHPEYIEHAIAHFDDPSVGGVIGKMDALNHGSLTEKCLAEEMKIRFSSGYIPFSAWIFRKKTIDEIGGFDERMELAEDRDLGIRIKEKGYRLVYEPNSMWWHKTQESFLKMARKSYWHGRERIPFVKKHPNQWPMKQTTFTIIFFLYISLIPSSFIFFTSESVFLIILTGFAALLGFQIYFLNKGWNLVDDRKFLLFLPFISLIRTISFAIGFIVGSLKYGEPFVNDRTSSIVRFPDFEDEEPFISIIIATMNRCESLRLCLKSLFAQNYKNFEVIVVDSGSIDDTYKLAEDFPIRYIETGPDVNASAARNLGISMAEGIITAFIDDDAIADPHWLERIVECYVVDSDVGGVRGKVIPRTNSAYTSVFSEHIDLGDSILETSDFGLGCNMSVRKEALLQIGAFDENIPWGHEEYDLSLRLSKNGIKLLYTPTAKIYHDYAKNLNQIIKKKFIMGRQRVVVNAKNGRGLFEWRRLPYIFLAPLSIVLVLLSILAGFFNLGIVSQHLLTIPLILLGIRVFTGTIKKRGIKSGVVWAFIEIVRDFGALIGLLSILYYNSFNHSVYSPKSN